MSQAVPETLRVLADGIAEGRHLGAQLYVSQRGTVMADLAIGEVRSGETLRPDHLMLWLSAGKPVTAMAVAQLCEAGRLNLTNPVKDWLPEFAGGGKDAITIEHLLTHTAGFRTADRVTDHGDWTDTLARICASPAEADWAPGQKAGYHISGSWYVLGELIRRTTGSSAGDYLRKKIFEPLGLSRSWVGIPSTELEQLPIAPVHVTEPPPARPHPTFNREIHLTSCRPGSNARGPVRELGLFYEAILQTLQGASNGLGLKPETVRDFTQRRRTGIFDYTFQHRMDWALGFIVNSEFPGADIMPYGFGQHASPATFGHGGAQSASAFVDPEHGLVVAWVCNGLCGEKKHQARCHEINTAIYADLGLIR